MMKCKKALILLLFSVILISAISTASAADLNMTDIQTSNDDVALEQSDDDVELEQSDEDVISENEKSFTDLNELINGNNNETIVLEHDYKYNAENDSAYSMGIVINREVTIDGKGHTIDGCNNSAKGFETKNYNILFKNITFVNLGKLTNSNYNGGAIHTIYSGGKTKVMDSEFIGCQGYSGGALYYVDAVNCSFSKCKSSTSGSGGGAVYSGTVVNCTFEGNDAQLSNGGALYYGVAINCIFRNNHGYDGGAVANAYVMNSTFIGNRASWGGGFYSASSYSCVNCTFINNTAIGSDYNKGGAVFVSKSYGTSKKGTVILCHFENNGGTSCGGVYGASIVLCTFKDNYVTQSGYNYQKDYGDYNFPNLIMKTSTISVNYPESISLPLDLAYYSTHLSSKYYPNYYYYFKDIKLNFTLSKDGQVIGSYQGLSNNNYDLNLEPGTYIVRYSFANSTAYNNQISSNTCTLTVKGYKTVIDAADLEMDYNNTADITATLIDDYAKTPLANKTLTVVFDGNSTPYRTDENGQITIHVPILPAKSYPVTIVFNGDDVYDYSSKNINVIIDRISTELLAEDVYAFYREGKITAKLVDKSGKALSNKSIDLELSTIKQTLVTNGSGEIEFDLGDLDNGTYQAMLLFKGDDGYVYSFKYINVKIGPLVSNIVAGDVTFIIGEDGSLIVGLTEADGTPIKDVDLKIEVGTISKTLKTNASGQVELNLTDQLDLGTYDANISFNGTERFIASNASVKVNVVQIPTGIIASDMSWVYGNESAINVTLKDKYGNPIKNAKITLDVFAETFTNITDENGTAIFLIKLPAKTHLATFSYDGNGSLGPCNRKINIAVQRFSVGVPTEFAVKSLITEYGSGKYLVATLKDENGNAVANAKINVVFNGKASVLTTNNKGQIRLSTNKAPNTYKVKFTFKGDSNYLPTEASVNLVVKKAATKFIAKKKTFKKAKKVKKYQITLKTKAGKVIKNAKVILKVKSKTYKAKTNKKGKATFKITKLNKKGKFKAIVKYKGNKYNKSSYKKFKITVK